MRKEYLLLMESFPSIALTRLSGILSIALWESQPIPDLLSAAVAAIIRTIDTGLRSPWTHRRKGRRGRRMDFIALAEKSLAASRRNGYIWEIKSFNGEGRKPKGRMKPLCREVFQYR